MSLAASDHNLKADDPESTNIVVPQYSVVDNIVMECAQ